MSYAKWQQQCCLDVNVLNMELFFELFMLEFTIHRDFIITRYPSPYIGDVINLCCLVAPCGHIDVLRLQSHMMTSQNENIFRVTGHLCGEFTGPRWIPRTKPVTQSFNVLFDLRLNKPLSKQS